MKKSEVKSLEKTKSNVNSASTDGKCTLTPWSGPCNSGNKLLKPAPNTLLRHLRFTDELQNKLISTEIRMELSVYVSC